MPAGAAVGSPSSTALRRRSGSATGTRGPASRPTSASSTAPGTRHKQAQAVDDAAGRAQAARLVSAALALRRTTTDGSEDSRARTPPLSCLGGVTSPFSGSVSPSHYTGAAAAPASADGGRSRHAPLAPLSIHEGALLSEAGLSPQGGAAAVSSTQDSLSGTMSPILTYTTFGAGKPRARPRSAAATNWGSTSGTGGGVRGRATSEASSGAVWRLAWRLSLGPCDSE